MYTFEVKCRLEKMIRNKEFISTEKTPQSVLAEKFNCSPMVVGQALSLLTQEGLTTRKFYGNQCKSKYYAAKITPTIANISLQQYEQKMNKLVESQAIVMAEMAKTNTTIIRDLDKHINDISKRVIECENFNNNLKMAFGGAK